ncbi:MAG: hypothetical protein ACRENC_06515, partial [Gemmatimonadaceae bacterium]
MDTILSRDRLPSQDGFAGRLPHTDRERSACNAARTAMAAAINDDRKLTNFNNVVRQQMVA